MRRLLCMVLTGAVMIGCLCTGTGAVDESNVVSYSFETTGTAIIRATGNLDWTIEANGTVLADTSFTMSAGETVRIRANYSPENASLDFGLVDSNEKFHYINVTTGSIDKTIEIPENGSYTLVIRNNLSKSVKVILRGGKGAAKLTGNTYYFKRLERSKNMKKRVLSLMLATVMCMALAVTANAVEYDSSMVNLGERAGSVLSVEQTSLINGNFPKNVRGETYGTALMAEVVGEMPDLQAAIGTDGQEGYVRTSDLSHPKFETPQDALEWQKTQPDSYYIPLYDFQGNEIGSFLRERNNLTIAEMEAMKG